MKTKYLLSFVMLCLFFNACNKEDELMPPNSKKVKREKSEQGREAEESVDEFSILRLKLDLTYFHDVLVGGCEDAEKWKNLMRFEPGSGVSSKIERLNLTLPSGWSIQDISDANGTIVNMDYFPVTIHRMPSVNGKEMSPLAFFEHVRKNLNDFVNTFLAKFRPIDTVWGGGKLEGETELWNSDHPYLAVLSIRIPTDDGSVICWDYRTWNSISESKWI